MSIFPLWFSNLNHLLIMDSLIGIMKDFVWCFFTMFQFYTPWNYPSNLWFSDVFREYKRETLGRNRSSFLTHFSPVFLFCIPCKRQKTLVLLLFPGGIKSEHWWNHKLFILIFTQFKNSFFQRATFVKCFRMFKWIARESLLHKVHGVHKQTDIGVQVNNLQTQGGWNNLNSMLL